MKNRAIPIFVGSALLLAAAPAGLQAAPPRPPAPAAPGAPAPAAPAPAPALGAQADQLLSQALSLMEAGKTKEAADVYNSIITRFSNSGAVPEATFRLAYAQYLLGQYPQALATLARLKSPPAPPQIKVAGDALVPQILAMQASKLAPSDPKRKAGFENAIKEFDAFIQKYPRSEEVESALYGRAIASFQMQDFDAAGKTVQDLLKRFPSSSAIPDYEYLLGVMLTAQGSTMQAAHADQAAVSAKFDDALRILADVIKRGTDVALANNAQFQIGEVQFHRGGIAPPEQREKTIEYAIMAYQAVQPKEPMVAAQQARIAAILPQIQQAAISHNAAAVTALQKMQERENAKLETLQAAPDQTMNAQLRIVGCYVMLQRFDEARVLLHYLEPFAQDPDQQKQILYYLTLTYASQGLMDKAVTGYDEFMSKYKGDPLGENLPVAMGSGYLSPKVNQPDKAIKYFDDESRLYPHSTLITQALGTQANALLGLQKYDEALKTYQRYLQTNPPKELAAAAEQGVAMVYQARAKTPADMGKAIEQYRKVAQTYPGTPQAEQSAYYAARLKISSGDAKGGLADLQDFVKKFPESKLTPEGTFAIGQVQAALGDKAGALQTYKDVIAKFGKTDFGPQAYFQEAVILGGEKKTDEMVKVMRDFLAAYPENKNVFYAYDTIGQTQVAAGKVADAVGTYTEMAEKHPDDAMAPNALYRAADLWRKQAQSQGHYLALSEAQRQTWNKAVASSMEAAEKVVEKYPDSEAAGLALKTLLDDQRLLLDSKQKTADDVQKYFHDLAAKFGSNPAAHSRILFTQATYTYETDKAKAIGQMAAAYDPSLNYAPADLDLYGSALLEQGKAADAYRIYEKIAKDNPVPAGANPAQAQPAIQEAQAIALFGMANSLEKQGQTAQAAKLYSELKATYPWSPKVIEANYGIAKSLVQQNKLDDALKLLRGVVAARTATAEMRAAALITIAQIYEKQNNLTGAIDSYHEVPTLYPGVKDPAAEGFWKGGQLLEQQAAGLTEQSTPKKSEQLAKAKRDYQDLVNNYPDSKFVSQAKDRLAALGGP